MNSKNTLLAFDSSLKNLNEIWTRWINEFQNSLELNPSSVELFEIQLNLLSSSDSLGLHKIPHVVFFKKDDSQKALYKKVFQMFRNIDPFIGIVVLTDGVATGKDSMTWLDLGATALISTQSSSKHLNEALRELFAGRLVNHKSRDIRVPVKHKVIIHIASLEQAIVSETLNLGLGGAFLRVVPPEVKVNDAIEFEFVISNTVSDKSQTTSSSSNPVLNKMESDMPSEKQNSLSKFSGKGNVVWIRETPSPAGHEGIGIHFTELDNPTKNYLLNFVKTHGFKSFIPQT